MNRISNPRCFGIGYHWWKTMKLKIQILIFCLLFTPSLHLPPFHNLQEWE